MRARRTATVLAALGVLGGSVGLVSAIAADQASTAKKKAFKPANGKFTGTVGDNAIIAFKAKGRNVKALNAGVQALCQRASNGQLRGPVFLVIQPPGKLKIDKKGRFSGEGQEDDTGIAWEIAGRFKSKKKAVGTFEASQFNLIGFFDSELCAGSGEWTAKLKQGKKK